jgi:hypothetical protein
VAFLFPSSPVAGPKARHYPAFEARCVYNVSGMVNLLLSFSRVLLLM